MSKLTPIERVQFARKVLLFLKFTRAANQAAWTGLANVVQDCEVWTCPFETILGRAEPKVKAEIDAPKMHGKEVAVALKIRGSNVGDWHVYYKNSYPQKLKQFIYESARKIEEEKNLA